MAPTTTPITDQLADVQAKALELLNEAQAPVAEYVTKVTEVLAARLPEQRPELVTRGIDTVVGQVDFAKKLLDAQVDFVKTVLDAAVKPVRPAAVRTKGVKTVKAA